jgi:putative ABC transport system permease protein
VKLLALSLRSLRREWHLPELRTLGASLLLAVVALGVVATLSTRMERGVLASAAELIGGDVGISSPQSLPASYAAQATQRGLKVTSGVRQRAEPAAGCAGHRQCLSTARHAGIAQRAGP